MKEKHVPLQNLKEDIESILAANSFKEDLVDSLVKFVSAKYDEIRGGMQVSSINNSSITSSSSPTEEKKNEGWTDEFVLKYAELYRWSSGRMKVSEFLEDEKWRNVVKVQDLPAYEEPVRNEGMKVYELLVGEVKRRLRMEWGKVSKWTNFSCDEYVEYYWKKYQDEHFDELDIELIQTSPSPDKPEH